MRALLRAGMLLVAAGAIACGNGDSPAATSEAQSPAPGGSPSATMTATATVTVPGVATDTPTPTETPGEPPALAAEVVVEDLERPTFVTHAGDGSGRLFVLEKAGRVRVVADGELLSTPFLSVEHLVDADANEQGLLGLAFHPDYAENGRFFIAYTSEAGQNALTEFRVSSTDANVADPEPVEFVVAIDDPAGNHNGGMVAFGPDGYLYLATGDGGGSGDPQRAGQDLTVLAGKILRLDVDAGRPYGIPGDNPFLELDVPGQEIWAYGLRNPWRFSFDRETGDLWIADVGQNAIEEVNFEAAGGPGGVNYGWSVMEGSRCFRPESGCATEGLTLPLFEYTHAEGCSITGGYVYRGEALAGLRGIYVYVDYCAGDLFGLRGNGLAGGVERLSLGLALEGVTSFGEDEAGEVYAVQDNGVVVKLVAAE